MTKTLHLKVSEGNSGRQETFPPKRISFNYITISVRTVVDSSQLRLRCQTALV